MRCSHSSAHFHRSRYHLPALFSLSLEAPFRRSRGSMARMQDVELFVSGMGCRASGNILPLCTVPMASVSVVSDEQCLRNVMAILEVVGVGRVWRTRFPRSGVD